MKIIKLTHKLKVNTVFCPKKATAKKNYLHLTYLYYYVASDMQDLSVESINSF